jgi:hypothetical protein
MKAASALVSVWTLSSRRVVTNGTSTTAQARLTAPDGTAFADFLEGSVRRCDHRLVDAVWGIVAGVVSGLAGAVVAGFVTLRKVRSDLAAEYDRDLRTKRLEHYRNFWPEFAGLATPRVPRRG